MKICINYCGMIRNIQDTHETFLQHFTNPAHEYHILYSTWQNHPVDTFKKTFPSAFICQYEPDLDLINNYHDYSMDKTNAPRKSLEHYLLSLDIKKKSLETFYKYKNYTNIDFDIVIFLRVHAYIYNTKSLSDLFEPLQDNVACVASEPAFNIYNCGALPDNICYTTEKNISKVLCHLDVLKQCTVPQTKQFHPETSFALSLQAMGFTINKKPFDTYSFKEFMSS
jgi:hypothetical protein